MELVHETISYQMRIIDYSKWNIIVLITVCSFIGILSQPVKDYWLYAGIFIITMSFIVVRNAMKRMVFWMELLTLDNDKVNLKVFNKNKILVDGDYDKQDIKFELVPKESKYTFYVLNLYLRGRLVSTHYELGQMSRYKMQEIIKSFHPNDKMANKKI